MNILVIGEGGREHAIVSTLKKDSRINSIYVSPGNGGMAKEATSNGKFNYNYLDTINTERLTPYDKTKLLKKLEREMKKRAEIMDFEAAIAIREKIKAIQAQ